jgi:DNA repair exonuclease SbcCD nuclease subunit
VTIIHKMATSKVNPKNNKVLFFSDLHLGVHQNSQTWHKICLDLAEWIDKVMKEHKLDTIFFAGDVFHDRHEIGVNTLHTAKRFFDILKDYQVHLVPGNHDAFLSSTVEVNSVEILERDNINVYTNPTTIQVGEKLVTFCPWKTVVKDLDKVDMLVGHFEIANFRMNATKICDHGDSSTDLLEKADAVVTGHFHYKEQRTYDGGKYVMYLGSPYEMDFGDREQQKGVTIIDFDDITRFEFIENDITPKHFRLKISELLQKKYTDLPNRIKGNIVSVYVDTKLDTLTLDLLISKLTQYGPLQFRTEFNILDTAQIDTKEVKKLSIDIETAFHEFVDHVETRASKKEVLDKCLELYKICQVSHE